MEVINGNAEGHAYFGVAIKPGTWDRLLVADFGAAPQIRAFDEDWQPLALGSAFANPFIGTQSAPVPGDVVPFNIQVLDVKGTSYASSPTPRASPIRTTPAASTPLKKTPLPPPMKRCNPTAAVLPCSTSKARSSEPSATTSA